MAGKRHHIIPKFLQKGFASREDNGTVLTWLYHKKINEPREISTTDAFVSEHFYGKGKESADDAITKMEENFARLVDAMRNGEIDPNDHTEEVAKLVSHISIRTKSVRTGFEKIADSFTSGVSDILTHDNLLTRLAIEAPDYHVSEQFASIIADSEKYPELTEVLDFVRSMGVSDNQLAELVVANMRNHYDDPETCAELSAEANEFVDDIFGQIKNSIPSSIRDGHIKSLKEDAAPETRVDVLREFDWRLESCDFNIILGDSGTIFKSIQNDKFVLSAEFDDIEALLLPISSKMVIVGRRAPEVNIEILPSLNVAIAQCSTEQFISSAMTEENMALICEIALEAHIATENEVDNELDDFRKSIENYWGSDQ